MVSTNKDAAVKFESRLQGLVKAGSCVCSAKKLRFFSSETAVIRCREGGAGGSGPVKSYGT